MDEPGSCRVSRPFWPRDGLSAQSSFQRACASRRTSDLSHRRDAGRHRRQRAAQSAVRGLPSSRSTRGSRTTSCPGTWSTAPFSWSFMSTPNGSQAFAACGSAARCSDALRHWTATSARAAAMICGAPSLNSLDGELRSLIDACHEESWRQADASHGGTRLHRRHRFPRPQVDQAARRKAPAARSNSTRSRVEAGLSRPHFYKLFRTQTGVTPHLYVNTLLDGAGAGLRW